MTLILGGITDTDGIPLTEEDGMQTGAIRGTGAGGLGIRLTGTCISVTTGAGTIRSMTLGGGPVTGLDTGTAIGPDTGLATGPVTVRDIGLVIGLGTDQDTILDTILEAVPVQGQTTAGMYTTAKGPHLLHIMQAGATPLQEAMWQEGRTQAA